MKLESLFRIRPSFILNWLSQKGYGGKTLTEGFMAYLGTKNGPGNTITECLNACLTNLGYTGTLDDKLRSFYISSTGISHPKDAEMAFYQGTGDFAASGGGGIDSNAKAMLHLNNDATDSSLTPLTITNSNVTFANTTPKFVGTSYGVFNGTSAYLTSTANVPISGTGDFTIEGWLYQTAQPGAGSYAPFATGSYNLNAGVMFLVSSNTTVQVYVNGGASDLNVTYTFTLNTWTHIAIVRSGTTLKMYINGTSAGSATNSENVVAGHLYIGANDFGGIDDYFKGNACELRFSNNARYTSDFTPQLSPFTT